MANFQTGNDESIQGNWGPPPRLEAANIGPLVSAILANRLGQQKLTQDTISEAIKAQQARQSSQAFIQGAQQYNLLPQGDLSGLSAHDAAILAQQIQEQTPDTDEDNLKKAMAAYYNAGAALGGRGRSRASGSMVTVEDDNGDPVLDSNGNPVQVPSGSRLGQHIIAQQNSMLGAPTASVAANIATKMGIPPQAVTDTGVHQGMGLVPGSGVDAQGRPYETKYMPVSPGDEPTDIQVSPKGIDPKTQQPYQPVIVQKDTLEQLRRALQGSSYRPQRGPQPGDINDQAPLPQAAPPTARPSVSTGRPDASKGAPVNLPQAGDVVAGYKFQGGDPNDRTNWIPVN